MAGMLGGADRQLLPRELQKQTLGGLRNYVLCPLNSCPRNSDDVEDAAMAIQVERVAADYGGGG